MKITLPASHLLKQLILFALTAMFLLTLVRAAYALWLFDKVEAAGVVVPLFLQGLRFDAALIGLVCLIPVVLGSLLAMIKATRGIAKTVYVFFLVAGLILILALELITPWFLDTQGLRPDLALIAGVENPIATLQSIISLHAIPLGVGVVVCLLIIIAFWSRLELQRFLRYRVSAPSSLLLLLVGGLVCLLATWSIPDFRKGPLSPENAQISSDATVNDLAMNSAYKVLYSVAEPLLKQLVPSAAE